MMAFLILCFLVPLVLALRRDYVRGVAVAVTLFVLLSHYLVLVTPGAFPNFTVHRVLLIALFLSWYGRRKRLPPARSAPFMRLFGFWCLVNFLSLLTCVEFTFGLKQFLSIVIEIWLFYIILQTSVRDEPTALRMLTAAWAGLAIVALLAYIERYAGYNPVDHLIPAYERHPIVAGDVLATYPHRILLGTAMSMGWPLAFGLLYGQAPRPRRRFLLWTSIVLLFGACYFSNSRGPWMASALAGIGLAILGSKRVRKAMLILLALVLITFIVRPGVWTTIRDRGGETIDSDTHKGSTYLYRWELWRIAYSQISVSPWRILVGYGPGSTAAVELEWALTYRTTDSFDVQSWDNHYAALLFQTGFLGLAAALALYAAVVYRIYTLWRAATDPGRRDTFACILVSLLVYLFMMTNVLIFAPQLDYLFWTLVCVAFAYGGETAPETVAVAAPKAYAGEQP